jgi:hypothetical protein
MTTAFVLGNGVSRKDISLSALQQAGKIYGCNALYREFTPDVLVATDRPISTYIQESGYARKNKFYTRKPIEGLGGVRLPEAYYGYSSGPNAVGLAAHDKNTCIYLLGFDMGPTENKQFNNLYAGTEFYKSPGATPTFTGNWVKQIVKIVSDYPQIRFFRIYGATTAKIPELNALINMEHQDLADFVDRINNKKDL